MQTLRRHQWWSYRAAMSAARVVTVSSAVALSVMMWTPLAAQESEEWRSQHANDNDAHDNDADEEHSNDKDRRFAGPTSSQPLALTANDAFLVVANPDNNSVTFFDVRRDHFRRLAEIKVQKEPNGVAFLPDGKKAYAANTVSGTVSVIKTDIDDGKIKGSTDQDQEAHQSGHRALRVGADAQWPQAVCIQCPLQLGFGDRYQDRQGDQDDQERRVRAARPGHYQQWQRRRRG